MKTKITTCGNCVYLCKTYNRYNPIKWKCAIRWWTYRPNNEKPCDKHKFKFGYDKI